MNHQIYTCITHKIIVFPVKQLSNTMVELMLQAQKHMYVKDSMNVRRDCDKSRAGPGVTQQDLGVGQPHTFFFLIRIHKKRRRKIQSGNKLEPTNNRATYMNQKIYTCTNRSIPTKKITNRHKMIKKQNKITTKKKKIDFLVELLFSSLNFEWSSFFILELWKIHFYSWISSLIVF